MKRIGTQALLATLHGVLLAGVVSAGCRDSGRPVAASDGEDGASTTPSVSVSVPVACDVDVARGALSCARTEMPPAPGVQLVILGGQGEFVQLSSANAAYNDVGQIFSADVTVQNLIGQALGTNDGSTVSGVQVFMHEEPIATSGSGTITVANADGTGTFTGSSQDFFLYNELLAPNQTSASKAWQFNVPTTVVSFEFTVLVDGAVEFPNGWVDVTPTNPAVEVAGATAMQAIVRDVVGRDIGGQVTWTTTEALTVGISPTGTLTGVRPGSATITAAAAQGSPEPGSASVTVSAATVISSLSDEFNAAELDGWFVRSDLENAAADGTIEIVDTVLQLIPLRSRFYLNASRGLSLFRSIDPSLHPRFIVEAFATALTVGTSNPPTGEFHSTGLAFFPDLADLDDWVVTNIGRQGAFLGFEEKNTVDASSDLTLYDTGTEFAGLIRICVVDSDVTVLTRLPSDANWTQRQTFVHTMGAEAAAGPMINYFEGIDTGVEGQLDYVRFMSITSQDECTSAIP